MPLTRPDVYDDIYANIKYITSLLEDPMVRTDSDLMTLLIQGIERNISMIKEMRENG